jgi:hypothetical protein
LEKRVIPQPKLKVKASRPLSGCEVELEIQLGMKKPAGKKYNESATRHAVRHALQTELITGCARTTEGGDKK